MNHKFHWCPLCGVDISAVIKMAIAEERRKLSAKGGRAKAEAFRKKTGPTPQQASAPGSVTHSFNTGRSADTRPTRSEQKHSSTHRRSPTGQEERS